MHTNIGHKIVLPQKMSSKIRFGSKLYFCFSILILFHLLAGPMRLFLAFPEILGFWRQVDRNRYRQDRIPYIRRCHRIYYRREDVYAYKEKLEKKKTEMPEIK